jgi:hypothetical protein
MAARSTHVTLTNESGNNLLLQTDSLEHGEWTTRPPKVIGNRGEWASESNGFATGTEGHVRYNMVDLDDSKIGEVALHWDNPFVGSNSYDESVSPAADELGDGFTVIHLDGSGNDANVEFQVLNGACQVDDSGEVSCSQASPITTAVDHRYASVWVQEAGPGWHARHNLTADEYQAAFDLLLAQNCRLIDVSGHGGGGEERYAGIWVQGDGPAFRARHRADADQWQQFFDESTSQGFRPTNISCYSVGNQGLFAGVFEQSPGAPFAARHNITGDEYQQAFDELTGQGFRPVKVSGCSLNGEERFAAIFEQRDGPAFTARHRIGADEYQQAFDQLTGQGFQPTCVSGYNHNGEDRYAAIFEQVGGPPFQARHRLTPEQHQQTFNELVGQGFRMVDVSGYTIG